jgi:hypothetical protein
MCVCFYLSLYGNIFQVFKGYPFQDYIYLKVLKKSYMNILAMIVTTLALGSQPR